MNEKDFYLSRHKIFNYNYTVQENDLDEFGHVNNANYLVFFENARWSLLAESGYTIDEIKFSKQGPTILSVDLKFHRELRLGDQFTIHSQVQGDSSKVMNLNQGILNQNDEFHSTAVFKMAFFSLERRKIIIPTPRWLEVIGYLE
jgi:YbgC/YbaW family acyl-CoA thioester hydrolase